MIRGIRDIERGDADLPGIPLDFLLVLLGAAAGFVLLPAIDRFGYLMGLAVTAALILLEDALQTRRRARRPRHVSHPVVIAAPGLLGILVAAISGAVVALGAVALAGTLPGR